MADVSMKDFLLQYYMQLRFNLMPAEVRAQYQVYVKSNDFRGNMKLWKSNLMHDNGNGVFVENALPDPNGPTYHLTDGEWENLFKAYQKALRGMAAARANDDESITENKDAIEFIDEYFGDPATHLFSNAHAASGYDTRLATLNTIFNAHPQIEYVLQQGGYTEPSFSDLKRGIAQKKYNTDPNFQSQLTRIIGFLAWKIEEDANIANWFTGLDLEDIYRNAFADSTIDASKLDYFKRNHQEILNILYKKDKVFNVFRNYDSGKISGQITKAREKLKYDDQNSDDYVPPKRDDQLTPLQQLSRWTDDTYDNLLDKYFKFHGDRLYFSKNAEYIVKAINGAKIKPTDGIDGVLKKSDDIKKNLLYKSPTATKHFDWFVKTLKEIQSTMPKAFAGALKNGRQMRAIISEMIIKAVRDGKTDEAKTMMEVLSVIKYGATTSKVMDALKKENLTIFSDGKLSWNKNDGVKFVTNALDKSIKAAFMGIGYGITFVGNEIRLAGSKFNGNRGRIRGAQQTWESQTSQDKQNRICETNTQNTNDRNEIANQQLNQRNSGIVDDNDLATKKQDSQTRQQDITNAQNIVNQDSLKIQRKDGQIQQYSDLIQSEKEKPDYQHAVEMDEQINNLRTQIQQLDDEIQRINTELANPIYNTPYISQDIQEIIDEFARQKAHHVIERGKLNATLTQTQAARNDPALIASLTTINNNINLFNRRKNAAERYKGTYENDFARHNAYLQSLQNAKMTLDGQISQYESATSAIDELRSQIQKRDDELTNWDANHQDKYMELMAYWDMLETGRDSHMGNMYNWLPRGKRAAQSAFNTQKGNIISNYLNGYSYAA